ncbi:MAG: hypothetical protein QNL62_21205, partial [Gammaproteobacteria bacterium]|nr:hypothetical protein [Gammaproteobacteria bacterium]
MNNQLVFTYFKGKLFKTMLLTMFLALFLFMAMSIIFIMSGIDQLKDDLNHNLSSSQKSIETSLDSNLGQITKSVEQAKKNTGQTLSSFLKARLKIELVDTEKKLRTALLKNGEVLADTLSKVSVDSILSRKFSNLVSYVKVANKDPNVIYTYFIRPDGKPYTRYVNRQNPKVKALLATGKGRSALEKLLDAVAKDKNIVEISRPIRFEDKEIASIKVAISIEEVNQNINKLVSSFETLVSDSNNKINQVLDQESIGMLSSLKNGFTKANKQNEVSTQNVLKQVETSSFNLLQSLTLMMIVGGIIVLVLLGLFFIIKVIRPILTLTDAMN